MLETIVVILFILWILLIASDTKIVIIDEDYLNEYKAALDGIKHSSLPESD